MSRTLMSQRLPLTTSMIEGAFLPSPTQFHNDPGGIPEIQTAFDTGTSDPVVLLQSLLCRIDEVESHVHAWTSVDRQGAMEQALQCRDALRRGERRSPLHGIPVAVKDVIDIAGCPTMAGSRTKKGQAPAHVTPMSFAH